MTLKHHSLRTVIRSLWDEISLPFLLLFFTLMGGALGYRILFPEESWTRLFYMTAITLSTVGYGDILETDQHPLAAWYTMLLMLAGMSMVVYALSSVTAFIVEGRLSHLLLENRIRRRIARMNGHYIVCGAGTLGVHVITEIQNSKEQVVVIDADLERLNRLKEEFPDLIALHGDATNELDLQEANIAQAKGLVSALSNDKENLFLTLTARQMNPDLKIVSRAVDINLHKRLRIAGADYIVSPNFIGGMRMASEILRPNVVTFLDRMLRGKDPSIRVSEVLILPESPYIGKYLKEVPIYEKTGLNMLAWSATGKNEDLQYNPGPETVLRAGGFLLFIGNNEQRKKLEHLLTHKK
ncbi:potassium channel protein [bacterium (Candidatus Blackallbacteria) CG17_big_fil_post_rev_8_21_14_2_50_48_46]|uniref:Potassium channel protein n=1 Tax=bacterium (Candidatus Blackallbacteria) CG17_big_fil_post_rev_8_21_14_2_50_48_46 TaxID=2014261 RepID=A0A2M7G364_9BACT|nr:MAG: potassium transporter TrkA [bacterium (Candidatus Blackallbacteria) CG18_big_fil_WC_8_21_14_2_50_49_26]PIW16264.1 MAG: potassium channel protein [bacterium (Candidatus Blackallbacteria) CG17_big_fil_post_rev_8_21_14_2_50_48_46]PIW49855.1 MAG: potassium channel protein [bacterium (Candidatus Blackallbacteria) CG13_big_fil_rev_8_21_14_2_50_49_14]